MHRPLTTARQRRSPERGFTLAELMAVVVIMGILATLAVVGYRKYINSAKSSEAVSMINGIKAAQEAYKAETLTYLDVSGTLNTYYPMTTPGPQKVQWGGGTSDVAKRWRILNVTAPGPVYYAYATIAGGPGTVKTDGLQIASPPTFANAVEPWYLVQARGDINGDGTPSLCVGSSFTADLYWEHEGE